MTDLNIWQHIITDVIPTAGVGGLLALMMFYFYRLDSNRNMERFDEIVKRQEDNSKNWMQIVQDNTAALVRLSERLK